jgi:phosphate-selective porin OprO/OprP
MTGKMGLMAGAAAIALLATPAVAQTNAELMQRLQDLESRLDSMSERATADRTRLSTVEQAYNSAVWTFDNGRPTFASGDGRFTMSIRTRFQYDFANFYQDDTHPAGFAGPADLSTGGVFRRVYFGMEGRAYRDFQYFVRLNFGGSDGGLGSGGTVPAGVPTGGEGDGTVNQMFVSYVGIPYWHFSIGALEPTMGGEGSTSSGNLMFIERPEINNISSETFGGSDSRRGIEIGYAKADALWSGDNLTVTAVFSGARTGQAAGHGNGGDEQSQAFVRISQRLWSDGPSNLQIGTTLGTVLYSGNAAGGGSQSLRFRDRPQVRVDGTRLIDTGAIPAKTGDLYSFDAGFNWQNFFIGGEWSQFSADRMCGTLTVVNNPVCVNSSAVIDHPTFSGFYVEGSWILTGEPRAYTPSSLTNETGGWGAPVPSRPFALDAESWGAWELVGRYSSTDLNWNVTQTALTNATGTSRLAGVLGGKQDIFEVGVNWYLNRNVKLQAHYSFVSVEKGIVTNLSRDSQDLNVLMTRLQFAT